MQRSIINEEDIKKLLESKAERMDVVELQKVKSNKDDTDNCLRWIDILHS